MAKKLHKSKQYGGALCGAPVQDNRTRRDWSKVSCRGCLDQRPASKGDDDKTLAEKFGKDAAIDVLDSFGDDLPDGAYWALAAELGVQPEDFIE